MKQHVVIDPEKSCRESLKDLLETAATVAVVAPPDPTDEKKSYFPIHNQRDLPLTLEEAVNNFERSLIVRALEKSSGIQTKAAELLGTTRRILRYRMDKLGIEAVPRKTT